MVYFWEELGVGNLFVWICEGEVEWYSYLIMNKVLVFVVWVDMVGVNVFW